MNRQVYTNVLILTLSSKERCSLALRSRFILTPGQCLAIVEDGIFQEDHLRRYSKGLVARTLEVGHAQRSWKQREDYFVETRTTEEMQPMPDKLPEERHVQNLGPSKERKCELFVQKPGKELLLQIYIIKCLLSFVISLDLSWFSFATLSEDKILLLM